MASHYVIDKWGTSHNDCMGVNGDNACYANPVAVYVDDWNGIKIRIPLCEHHIEVRQHHRRNVNAV
jgi:hypothetical protein